MRMDHRSMERNEVSGLKQSTVQGRDVAEAHEDLWMTANRLEIEQREHASRAVSAADAEDCLHFGIREHCHKISCALTVTAREETPPSSGVGRQFCAETESFNRGDTAVNALRVGGRARRSDNADELSR